MKKSYLITIYVLLAFWAGYEAHNNKVFPLGIFIERNFFEKEVVTKLQKKVHAYVDVSKKSEVSCPAEDNAYVIIGFGQSNSANYAGYRFESNKDIVNFYNGKCYVAIDPLLGATGRSGSVWIPLSEELNIKDKTIVLSTFGVGGTKVSDWLNDDYLMPFYKENIDALNKVYEKPNAVVWIQGESDVSTPSDVFSQQLKDWFEILRTDFSDSNIYVTGTSYCGGKSNDSVLLAQSKQSKSIGAVYVGSADKLVQQSYRYDDCHFSEKGSKALASLIAASWIK
jgi:hypothetical protein